MRNGLIPELLDMFILLSLQFHSYPEPLIAMAAIPLTLICVIWGHFLTGIECLMGFISLSGVVVNDSILLERISKLIFAS